MKKRFRLNFRRMGRRARHKRAQGLSHTKWLGWHMIWKRI